MFTLAQLARATRAGFTSEPIRSLRRVVFTESNRMNVKPTDRSAGVVLPREPVKAPPTADATSERTQAAASKPQSNLTTPAAAASSNTNLRFNVDKDSGKTVIASVAHTGKVRKQLPTEEALAVAEAIDRYQGVFVDRKA